MPLLTMQKQMQTLQAQAAALQKQVEFWRSASVFFMRMNFSHGWPPQKNAKLTRGFVSAPCGLPGAQTVLSRTQIVNLHYGAIDTNPRRRLCSHPRCEPLLHTCIQPSIVRSSLRHSSIGLAHIMEHRVGQSCSPAAMVVDCKCLPATRTESQCRSNSVPCKADRATMARVEP